MNSEELVKLNDTAEFIKELIEGLEKEDIERLTEKKDKLIYSHYLENKKLVKGKDFIHAALEGIGEYDFEVKTEKMYVDVKTTLYSLKDGTAPFYLHRSQNVFMQKHPDSKYHIVRISLIDLNLKKSYEELRDMAEKYWRGAQIEEFDALSPEYAIRIEQKVNR